MKLKQLLMRFQSIVKMDIKLVILKLVQPLQLLVRVNCAWSKLENPVKGTDYDYLYINDKYVPAEAVYTQDEVLAKIQERFSNKDMGYELLDAPESDMQKAEFSVDKEETIPTSVVDSYLYAELHLSDYTKFYIEENGEDAANYNFVIYYKDLYQAE